MRARSHEDRVTVGRRFRDCVGADDAARSGTVIDDDGLTPDFSELLADRSRSDIERSARRERHHETNRLDGIRCGFGGKRAAKRENEREARAKDLL